MPLRTERLMRLQLGPILVAIVAFSVVTNIHERELARILSYRQVR
ncbi:MAG: hypothetical protein NT059_06905 [Planctomycetota bacterium]|nr:hypothetical protein [Planctomycetota bacterium]